MIDKGDCLELMKQLPDNSVDAIVTDPPYEYLKHKLDRYFDEQAVFEQWNRIVKSGGFIVFFGRGESFHRWNVMLNEMGWKFKEEVVWNKRSTSSPVIPLSRIHETISILSKNGKIRRVHVPYFESKKYQSDRIEREIKQLMGAMKKSSQSYTPLLEFMKNGTRFIEGETKKNKYGITLHKGSKQTDRAVDVAASMLNGQREQSIIEIARPSSRKAQHPTQKPTQLMERLIALVSDPGNLILDPFMGSGSTGIAAINTNRDFIGYEIDDEYFKIAKQRIRDETQQISLDLGGNEE